MRVDRPDTTVIKSKDDFILHNQYLETRIERLEKAIMAIVEIQTVQDKRDKILEAIKK